MGVSNECKKNTGKLKLKNLRRDIIHNTKLNHNSHSGFTLIELLLVMAIIGILISMAYPRYKNVLARSARNTAQSDLMTFANAMERHSASYYSYKGAGLAGANTGLAAIFPAYSPTAVAESNKNYILTIESVDTSGQSYIIKATPLLGSVVAGSGALYYYSDGRKGWDFNANNRLEPHEFCWACESQ